MFSDWLFYAVNAIIGSESHQKEGIACFDKEIHHNA
jgi:hypothetical protein